MKFFKIETIFSTSNTVKLEMFANINLWEFVILRYFGYKSLRFQVLTKVTFQL